MSRLDELIQELCPNGVEYKTVSSISKNITSGGTPKTGVAEYYNGDIPWLRTQEVNFDDITDTGVKITQLGVDNSSAKWIPENCVIVAMYGATVGKVAINKIPMTTNQACCNIELDKEKALYRYVFHCLCNQYQYIKSLGQGSQTNINAQIVKKLTIPVPPLEVQSEIVRILDNFTEITALREIAEYSHKRINAIAMKKDNYVGVDNLLPNKAGKVGSNYVPTKGNLTAYVIGDVLIGNIRPYLKKIWLAYNEGGASGDVLVIHLTDQSVDVKYLYQVLAEDKFFNYNMQFAKGAKMPRGSKQKIMDYIIPVPSLEEQRRIVSILDKFDMLTTSISEGLPKEIELRRKQYEYYRNQLLSFPDNKTTA